MLLPLQLLPLLFTNIFAGILLLIICFAHSVPLRLRITSVMTTLSLLLWQNWIHIADAQTANLVIWNTLVFIWPTVAVLSFFLFIVALRSVRLRDRLSILYKRIAYWMLIGGSALQVGSLFSGSIFHSVLFNGVSFSFER